MAALQHGSLGAKLQGVARAEGDVWQFRGLQYASIPARFASPQQVIASSEAIDCTKYGPRCPQTLVDVGHLLRIPEDIEIGQVSEDEFECLNLDVTMPPYIGTLEKPALPVMLWIHGGSQVVTFGSSASNVCDPTNLVRASIQSEQPIIVVTINYRLNMFAFGDGSGERNLALQDQRAALDWVKQHITDFGGDPENITLAGESAGAVYAHAHLVSNAPIRQCILQSGSLYLSPPQPETVANMIVGKVSDALAKKSQTIRDAPVADLVNVQAELGIKSLFLQMEPGLENWESKLGEAERLLVGDCEYESVFFRNGIETATAEFISNSFDTLKAQSTHLKALYGIVPSRPTSCKLGALDFLQDVRLTLGTEQLVRTWRKNNRPVFRYLCDQSNPWQASARAHHAVDLLLLFAGFDLSHNPGAQRVSAEMARKWIAFCSGREPWKAAEYFAFGPLGESREIDEEGFADRRRKRQCDAIEKCGIAEADVVWKTLGAGRISLEN